MSLRVVLLEDEDAIRSAVERGLVSVGHQVLACASVAEARARAPAFLPQALVSDLKLTDGSGLEIAELLAVPAVFLSGYATFDDAVTALRAGAVEFLTKPASLRDIRRALERIALARAAGPQVIMGEGDIRCVRAGADALRDECITVRSAAWSDAGYSAAQAAYTHLLPVMPKLVQRRIAAALFQAAPSGRLTVNLGPELWTCLLESSTMNAVVTAPRRIVTDLARQLRWTDQHVLVAVGDGTPGDGVQRVAVGEEWLWPCPVPPGDPLDLSAVSAVGAWFHTWLEQRPGLGVMGAQAAVRRQLEAADLSVCWLDQPRPRPGLSAAERADLLG